VREAAGAGARAERQLPAARLGHRLDGVHGQVDEDLHELAAVTEHARERRRDVTAIDTPAVLASSATSSRTAARSWATSRRVGSGLDGLEYVESPCVMRRMRSAASRRRRYAKSAAGTSARSSNGGGLTGPAPVARRARR
jgi:hypothetical protein